MKLTPIGSIAFAVLFIVGFVEPVRGNILTSMVSWPVRKAMQKYRSSKRNSFLKKYSALNVKLEKLGAVSVPFNDEDNYDVIKKEQYRRIGDRILQLCSDAKALIPKGDSWRRIRRATDDELKKVVNKMLKTHFEAAAKKNVHRTKEKREIAIKNAETANRIRKEEENREREETLRMEKSMQKWQESCIDGARRLSDFIKKENYAELSTKEQEIALEKFYPDLADLKKIVEEVIESKEKSMCGCDKQRDIYKGINNHQIYFCDSVANFTKEERQLEKDGYGCYVIKCNIIKGVYKDLKQQIEKHGYCKCNFEKLDRVRKNTCDAHQYLTRDEKQFPLLFCQFELETHRTTRDFFSWHIKEA